MIIGANTLTRNTITAIVAATPTVIIRMEAKSKATIIFHQ